MKRLLRGPFVGTHAAVCLRRTPVLPLAGREQLGGVGLQLVASPFLSLPLCAALRGERQAGFRLIRSAGSDWAQRCTRKHGEKRVSGCWKRSDDLFRLREVKGSLGRKETAGSITL